MHESVDADFVETVLASTGEMGSRMRAHDWASTPLGSPTGWPQSLRSVLSMMLPSKAQIILFWGPDFIVFYNDAYRPVFGAKHPHALGLAGRDAWREIWDTMLHGLLTGVVRTGEAFWAKDLEFVIARHGFEEETYFDVSYDPVRVENGAVGGVYCIVTETTERVVGQRRMTLLKDLATRYATARTARDVGTLAMQTLATAPHDISFALLYLDDELQGSTPNAEVQQAAAEATTGATAVHELLFRAPGADGGVGRLVIGLNPRRPFDESYRAFVGLVASQLETALATVRAYEEQRQRAEALVELDRAKTAFFSNVSHEFRTPLTLMLGPLEDMLAGSVSRTPDDTERLALIHRNGLRLLKLVNTLLEFSRIEAGRIQAAFQPTDLAALTIDLASAFRSAIERAGMELIVACPALTEPVYVDREMWEKIVLNLLSNAFKYTLAGRITVTLRQQTDAVQLIVRDTGVGIPEKELPHVFERFHRVANVKGRTHEGTGIGLALVQELVKLHGGTVHAASISGEGSTFTVSIPLGSHHLPENRVGESRVLVSTALGATPYVEEALRWLPESPQATTPEPMPFGDPGVAGLLTVAEANVERPRIVLADDNADMRDYLRRILNTRYDVEPVPDGLAALAAAQRRRPDLILADVMMPGLDGFGLLRALGEDPDLRTVPVVLLSARAGEEARVEGLGAGANDYLVKPFSARELLSRIESHLRLVRVRREAEAAIRESETRFRALVLASSDAVYRMNADWTEMRFLEGRNFIADTHQASRNWLSTYIHPEDQATVLEVIDQAIRTKSVFELEHRVLRVDGSLGWTFSRAIPILDTDGHLVEWFGTATDVTERKRIEEALQLSFESEQRARAEAEHASRMKDEFLTMLSHELRTPLNAILGWAQLLNDQSGVQNIRHGLSTIERNAWAQVQLIEDLLDVSRITEGRLRLNVQRVALREIIEAALASVRPAADAKGIRIQMLLDGEADQVNGDPARLQQVVWNLVNNAVKFTPKGGRIQVLLQRVNSHVTLTVSDNGEGIDPDFLPYIFDRFRQADQSTTRRFSGLGLGLSIVKHLVELHGGTVGASSPGKGQGATFVVDLPLTLDRRGQDGSGEHRASLGPLDVLGDDAALLAGVTVLYVDDELDARELATRVLSAYGARVIAAASAAQGRQLLASEHPAVLVADVGMPQEDGYTLIRSIRALPAEQGGNTPAAAVTALARPEDRQRALLAGFQTHVAKPVNVLELAAVVASLAGRTGRSSRDGA